MVGVVREMVTLPTHHQPVVLTVGRVHGKYDELTARQVAICPYWFRPVMVTELQVQPTVTFSCCPL
ncbi:protein of unknown function [Candidatus Promineifilum breve]|uniref:Uncharacterized protein n=1 Tax=Candidatus Promineifilum breve TaxID=1806508 RepID=A0A160T8H7_9CHLR|nr:protein of unknown function [Candidatus Promineifilum breve]